VNTLDGFARIGMLMNFDLSICFSSQAEWSCCNQLINRAFLMRSTADRKQCMGACRKDFFRSEFFSMLQMRQPMFRPYR
jgi:hypothetical protein